MEEKEQVWVTFYRFPDWTRWIVKGDEVVPLAEVLHPTRITQEEWEAILAISTDKVQAILSLYLKI